MTAWLPLLIQVAEAAALGAGAMIATHQAGADWQTAIIAGVVAAFGKAMPSQVVGKKA